MRHDRRLVLVFLTGAMVAAGCSGSSGVTDASTTGAGGAKGMGGAGGGSVDSGTDHGPSDTGAAGSDGGTDVHADVTVDQATDTGAGDTAIDMATDTGVDTGPHDVGPCVTSYGAGNSVLYAFDGGANANWYTYIAHDTNNTMFTTSLGASYVDGRSCAGALLMAVNFFTFGGTQSGALEHFFGTSPAGASWVGYKALHAWIKLEGDLSEMNGVYFYVKSGGVGLYQSDFAAAANLHDWHEVVIDLTRPPNTTAFSGVAINDVQLVGFEALLNTAAAVGASPAPSQILLLADDIWLEAAPPVDAGTGDAQASDGGGQ